MGSELSCAVYCSGRDIASTLSVVVTKLFPIWRRGPAYHFALSDQFKPSEGGEDRLAFGSAMFRPPHFPLRARRSLSGRRGDARGWLRTRETHAGWLHLATKVAVRDPAITNIRRAALLLRPVTSTPLHARRRSHWFVTRQNNANSGVKPSIQFEQLLL